MRLIDCSDCGHDALHHPASGCAELDCACPQTQRSILEREIALARVEFATKWIPVERVPRGRLSVVR